MLSFLIVLGFASFFFTLAGNKPTVQVHPMPSSLPADSKFVTTLTSLASSNNKSDITLEKMREKPVVPKKPIGLIQSSASTSGEAVLPSLGLSTSSLNPFPWSAQSSPSTSSKYAHFLDLFEIYGNLVLTKFFVMLIR